MTYVFGALGIFVNILLYQQKTGQRLIIYKLISDVLWAFHYLFLGAFSGVAVAVIGIFRELVFFIPKKSRTVNRCWLLFFVICSILSAVLTWKGMASLLPATASVISVISFWRKSPWLSCILAFPISAAMLTYDMFCHSYFGILNEVFTLVSAIFALIQYKRRRSYGKE